MNDLQPPTTRRTDTLSSAEMLQAGPRLERWLSLAALAFLLMGPVLLAWMYLTAWQHGELLSRPEDWGSNHGPWRHAYDLRECSNYALGLPLLAVPAALLSLCFRRTPLAFAVLLAVPIYEVLALASLFPMLD